MKCFIFSIAGIMLVSEPVVSVKELFADYVSRYLSSSPAKSPSITESNIAHLPAPVQRYLSVCGYLGTGLPDQVEIVWKSSHIKMRPGWPWMRLRTHQYNSVSNPVRIAYMQTNLMGCIPFEGCDLTQHGQGHMFGRIANSKTIFDERGPELSQSAFITLFAETLLIPAYALQPYIQWQAIDDLSARATISRNGINASGTFYFNREGEFVRFETNDRYYSLPEGGFRKTPFAVQASEYKLINGVRIPTEVSAEWLLSDGPYKYWKGTIAEIKPYSAK